MARKHTVAPGECIASIAFENGFFPDTVWDAPENAGLRALRPNGYVLAPGDELFIPELRPKEVDAAAGRQHVFRRKGVPERLSVRLLDSTGQPRAGVGYTLTIDGVPRSGETGADGSIRDFIPPDARRGVLELSTGETFTLRLGHLAPGDSVEGAQQRLKNLGHHCGGDRAGTLGPGTQKALAEFLRGQGRTPPETWDDGAFADAAALLRDQHGS